MSGPDTTTGAQQRHGDREREARVAEASLSRTSSRLSVARLATAFSAFLLGVWSFESGAPEAVGWLALVSVVIFLILVIVHDRIERSATWQSTIATWHGHCRSRLLRAWAQLPPSWRPELDPHHPFAHDLDLFGPASLFELIGPPGTWAGRTALASWLLGRVPPGEVDVRQQAVRELVPRTDLCERIAAHGHIVGRASAFDLQVFLDWAEADPWLLARPWVTWSARTIAVTTLVLILAQSLSLTTTGWWLLPLMVGVVASWVVRHRMEQTLGRAVGWEPAIRAYVAWLELVETTTFSSPGLESLQRAVGSGHERASRRIKWFQHLVALAELRHTALLHFPIHALTLWDFHVWWALERWQRASGRHVRVWLDALGQLESLVSLATLANGHPDWAQPRVTEGGDSFEAHGIGHPLLRPDACVRNDVRVGPRGRVLCVTGSNMSGKSTLLRAIGVNAVLAQAGAPVCATALTMPPVDLYTSLRVVDSLAEGVSFFMAALAQLKRLVQAADEADRPDVASGHRRVFYLLDEILQGTNSLERVEAVRIVLRHLLATSAIGAITTHDLALTTTPELQAGGDHVHFRETIHEDADGVSMTFDYLLRPGVATSRNALALLRLVGLA